MSNDRQLGHISKPLSGVFIPNPPDSTKKGPQKKVGYFMARVVKLLPTGKRLMTFIKSMSTSKQSNKVQEKLEFEFEVKSKKEMEEDFQGIRINYDENTAEQSYFMHRVEIADLDDRTLGHEDKGKSAQTKHDEKRLTGCDRS